MNTRLLMPTSPKLQLSKRCVIERIGPKPLDARDGPNLFDASVGSLQLSNGDRPVEGYYRRRGHLHQGVIERDNRSPVGVFHAGSLTVDSGDCRLHVVLGELRPTGG